LAAASFFSGALLLDLAMLSTAEGIVAVSNSYAKYMVASAIAISLLAGCGGSQLPIASPDSPAVLRPSVRQQGGGSTWVRLLPKTVASGLYTYNGFTIGPDRNVWFQDVEGNGIVRMAETGAIKEFAVPQTEDYSGIAVGADARFYVGAYNPSTFQGYVDAIDQSGTATAYPIGAASGTDNLSGGIAKGPDGNVWFVEYQHIGKITTSGTITQYPYPNGTYYADPGDLVQGSDGNMWFTLGGAGVNPAYLVKIVPSTGVMTSYNLTSLVGCAFDNALTEGPDGNVWVDCGTSIVRVTTGGMATAFATPNGAAAGEVSGDMTPGAGQTIWYGGANDSGNLVQYDIGANAFHVFRPPAKTISQPRTTIVAPDTNVWFSAIDPSSGRMEIGVHIVSPIIVSPTSVTLSGPGASATLAVSENGVSSWKAKSSNVGVATIAKSGQGSFKVTAVSAGSCVVAISDQNFNFVEVEVTVN
jgi:virginiamycin B lyase